MGFVSRLWANHSSGGTDKLDAASLNDLESRISSGISAVPGVPAGGTAGQVIAKVDGTDFNTAWVAQTGGSGSSGYVFRNEENLGVYAYVGYEKPGADWYIYRRTLASNLREYATGVSGYGAGWTGRAGLTYA